MLRKLKTGNGRIWGMLMLLFVSSSLFAQETTYSANEIQFFEAKHMEGRGIQLDWASKYNDTTAYFVVERSLDGMNFEQIGEVKATNTRTNHKFIDRTPYKNVSYYRLQVIDYDGRRFISHLISAYIPNQGQPELVLYPMPVGNSETLSLRFQGVEQSCKVYVQVTDQNGRKVLSREAEISSFQNISELQLEGQLAPGNYQVTVVGHSGSSFKIGRHLQITR